MDKFSERIPEGFTPGEWWWDGNMLRCHGDENRIIPISRYYYNFIMGSTTDYSDLKLIALAPEMAAEIIRLEEENKRLQGERDFDQSWNAELRGIIETLLTDNQKMRELLDGALKESDDA